VRPRCCLPSLEPLTKPRANHVYSFSCNLR
jgi:hypothetical protein